MDKGECISDDSMSGVKVCMCLLYMLVYIVNSTQTNIVFPLMIMDHCPFFLVKITC